MPIKIKSDDNIGEVMAKAMASGDEAQQVAAWSQFHRSLVDHIAADYEELKDERDDAVLAQRGYRRLTSAEKRFYEGLAEALKSETPQARFAEVIGTDEEDALMPETVIEDVYKGLVEEYPLLQRIDFQYTAYAIKWILTDKSKQRAVWGKVTDPIKEEIASAFKVVSVHQDKLSAFAFIERGMLDMGPMFLDAYIRAVLTEALSCGLEQGAVTGNGVDCPIGMDRKIAKGVSFNTETGYPRKDKVKLTSFAPAEYGALLARLSVNEDGAMRKFSVVQIICNMTDYLTKVMPATTALATSGEYVSDRFPFPTEVIISNELETGEALLGLLDEYSMFIGSSRDGEIEVSDDYKFLDDTRYFKVVQYGTGRAFDDTSFMLLDISELDPLYVTVRAASVSDAAKLTA